MAWTILVIAGVFEVGWAIGLKYADGFSRVWPSVWTVAARVASVVRPRPLCCCDDKVEPLFG